MSEDRKRGCFKLTCLGCVAMPFLAVLITYGAIKCQASRIGDRLPQEVAKLKALGAALEPGDLEPNPPIPTGQNAAHLLNPLIEEFKKIKEEKFYKDFEKRLSESSRNRTPAEDDSQTVATMRRLEPFLQRVDKVNWTPRLYFKRDWTLGASVMFPEYAYLKQIAKLEADRSRIAVKAGDPQTSLSALKTCFKLSDLVSQEPTIIAALVAVSIHTIGYVALENHLERFQGNRGAVKDVLAILQSFPGKFDLKRPLDGEIVMTRQWLRSASADEFSGAGNEGYSTDSDRVLAVALRDPAVRRMYEVRYLELWSKAFAVLPADHTDWRGLQKAAEVVDKELQKPATVDSYLNQLLYPVLGQYPLAAGEMQARHRLAILAAMLLLDRSNGLPADLKKYGSLAIDPMDGLPVRYIRKGSGFKIWSNGKDQFDNGGVKYWRNAGMTNQDTDEVLMFGYPESPPARPTPPKTP
jgi:hypothetical protein